MKARSAPVVAWFLCLAAIALGVGAVVLFVLSGRPPVEVLTHGELVSAEIALTFSVVGAVIASKRPDNPIGWILCGVGVSQGLVEFTYLYTRYAYVTEPGSLPAAELVAWLSSWTWQPGLVGMLIFLPLLFPNGRLLSRRWRPLAWLSGVASAGMIVGTAVSLWPVRGPKLLGPVEDEARWLEPVLLLLLGCAVGSAISLIARFRRSRGDERQQLKWFTFAVAALLLFIAVYGRDAGSVLDALIGTLGFVIILGVPAALGVALLKYRLYDIDLIINRTLVYGALSAILAVTYLALVTGVSSLAGDSPLTVAASTLAVAALFRPLRARVQGFIDRRFYRQKYDAQRTIDDFSARLRDEVSLDSLTTHLLDVVQDTMHPERVSLWLRPSGAGAVETNR
ncbi:MAG: hypothetical protein ABR575_02845 [Actinomycetota bacterium]